MKHQNLIEIWLHQACPNQQQAIDLLSEHGFFYSQKDLGNIGGAYIKPSRNLFEFGADGEFMIIQGIWQDPPTLSNPIKDPILYDLVAWHPKDPERYFFFRGEHGLILGEKALYLAQHYGDPLYLHRTPEEYFKNQGKGCVVLDRDNYHCLLGAREIIVNNPQFGNMVSNEIKRFLFRDFPKFYLQKNEENK